MSLKEGFSDTQDKTAAKQGDALLGKEQGAG